MNHGGNLHDAKALFPEAPEPWIDLSTGINPNAYPVSLNDPTVFTRLPSQQAVRDLEHAAAQAYGVPDPDLIVAAPGSQSLIELLPRLRPKGRVAIVGPTYNEHAACWMGQGHECIDVANLPDALSERPDIIVLVNPNNPDGRVVAAPELARAAAIMHARGGWLVVDEAFADLEDGVSIAHRHLPGTIILRSFGKTYGLAGIRLGFAIAARPTVDEIRAQLGLWAISGPALAIGVAAFADRAWLVSHKDALKAAVSDLDRVLSRSGFRIVGGTLLFRLARHPAAASVFDDLARAGIWVRKFPHDAAILRFGIPPKDGLPRLEAALNRRLG